VNESDWTWYWKDVSTGKEYFEQKGTIYEIVNNNGYMELIEISEEEKRKMDEWEAQLSQFIEKGEENEEMV